MWIALLLSIIVGTAIVVQNGANAHLMKNSSLWLLLAVGNLVAAGLSAAFFLTQRKGEVLADLSRLPPLVLVPAVCGFAITAGMPLAIERLGVFKTVLLVIACQILAGIAWDRFVTETAVAGNQLFGAALILGGVLLVLKPAG
ncbi:MAG: DMT family transporter [Acidobacteriota bacterium]